jgi:hypothetical protein
MKLKIFKICLLISIFIPVGIALQTSLNLNEVSEISPAFEIETQWDLMYGGSEGESLVSIIQTNDDGFIMYVSQETGIEDDFANHWIIKTDSNGQVLWDYTHDVGENWLFPQSIVQTRDNGYLFISISEVDIDPYTNYDTKLVKLNENGEYVSEDEIGHPIDWEVCQDIIPTSGGYVIAGGIWHGNNQENADFYLMKIDETGQPLWNQTYGGPDYEFAGPVVQTTDGGYLLTGGLGEDQESDIWVVKTDSEGNHQWDYTLGGEASDGVEKLIQTAEGGFAIGATTQSYGVGRDDFWLIKLDSNGNPLWNKTYGYTGRETLSSLIQTSDGGFALIGSTNYINQSLGATNSDIWLVKTDSEGEHQWNGRVVMEQDEDWGDWIVETDDRYFVIAGVTKSKGAGSQDLWLMKTTGEAIVPTEQPISSPPDTSDDDEWKGWPWMQDNIGVLAIITLSTLGLGGLVYYTTIRSGVESTVINNITENTVKRIFNSNTSKYLLVAGNVIRDKPYGSATNIPPELFEYKALLHPVRMAMMKVLIDNPLMTSVELKEYLNLTWSEYRNQMNVLKKLRYVYITEKFVENSVKQVISVESHGMAEFDKLSKILVEFLSSPEYEEFSKQLD